MTVALHQAAHGDKRHGGKSKFLGAQKARHGNIGAIHELAVCFKHHAGAQAVFHERLLRLGKAHLKRQPCMPDGIAGCGARAAVMARDEDLARATLGNARGNGAHACLRYQLHAYTRLRICAGEVKNELGEIFDRVDVVMGRRRDKADARGGLAHARNPGVHLFTRQMTAFARLCALGHLDLQLACRGEVAAGNAKAATCHLFDGRVCRVAVGKRRFAPRVFTAPRRSWSVHAAGSWRWPCTRGPLC